MIHAHLTLGQFTAFYLYLNMLIAPMRTLGVILDLAQRATASGARIFQVLDRPPRLTSPPGAPPLPRGQRARAAARRHAALRRIDEFGAAYSATSAPSSARSPAHSAASTRNGAAPTQPLERC